MCIRDRHKRVFYILKGKRESEKTVGQRKYLLHANFRGRKYQQPVDKKGGQFLSIEPCCICGDIDILANKKFFFQVKLGVNEADPLIDKYWLFKSL